MSLGPASMTIDRCFDFDNGFEAKQPLSPRNIPVWRLITDWLSFFWDCPVDRSAKYARRKMFNRSSKNINSVDAINSLIYDTGIGFNYATAITLYAELHQNNRIIKIPMASMHVIVATTTTTAK